MEGKGTTYDSLKATVGIGNAANLTSALITGQLCDGLIDLIGDQTAAASSLADLLVALLDKECYAELLSLLEVLCAMAGQDFPEEIKEIGDSPADQKILLGEIVSDFQEILAEEFN